MSFRNLNEATSSKNTSQGERILQSNVMNFAGNALRNWWLLRRYGLPLGTDTADDSTAYLALHHLARHLHLIGPPGSGKTRLLFWIFQMLCSVPKATVILMNPKGSLCRDARDWMIQSGMAKRLVWFDPGSQGGVLGYNPMAPNGLGIATHAKKVRESIRSAWGQSDFDQTPQMARYLYLALATARSQGWGIVEAMQLLRPGSRIRAELLPHITDPFLYESLAYFDRLRDARQEELAASTLARLEAFTADETIRRVLTHSPSVDLARVIQDHQVLLVNLEFGRPLMEDDVRLLGRFIVNDVLNHAFQRSTSDTTPIFLICDEVQNFATRDLCSALAMGRELGLHCILAHQELSQLRDEEKSGVLYGAVMGCCRTRFLFGGLSVADLEILAKEVMIDAFDPRAIKDELTTLELEPHESRRATFAGSVSLGGSFGRSSATSSNIASSRSYGSNKQVAFSRSRGLAISTGAGTGSGSGNVVGETLLPSGEIVNALQQTNSNSNSTFTAESETEAESESEGYGVQQTSSEGTSYGEQFSRSRAVSPGVTGSLSIAPFYEYLKRRNISSRTFISPEEFFMMAIQKIKGQPDAHFVVKVPNHSAIFCKAPFVSNPKISCASRAETMEKIFSQDIYSKTALQATGIATYQRRAPMLQSTEPRALPQDDQSSHPGEQPEDSWE